MDFRLINFDSLLCASNHMNLRIFDHFALQNLRFFLWLKLLPSAFTYTILLTGIYITIHSFVEEETELDQIIEFVCRDARFK